MPGTSENAALIARFTGHAKPSGTEASATKMIYAALPVITIPPARNQVSAKKNEDLPKPCPLLFSALLILLNLYRKTEALSL